jgi:MFS family permease
VSEPAIPTIWRNSNFWRVLVGSTVNDTGDWMLALALPIYVFTVTGSGRDTAAVFLIQLVIDVALGPYGGALADRWDLRRTIVATNILQALTLLPLLAASRERVWIVLLVAAAQAILQQVNNPASFALVPRVVTDEQLVSANAAFATGGSISRLVGAPLGGIAVGLGGLDTIVVIDAITFMAVAIAVAGVTTVTPKTVDDGGDDETGGVREGWLAIRDRPTLVGWLVVQSLAQLAFAMFPVLFIKFVVDKLDGGGATIGIIRGSAAFGALAASLVIQRYGKQFDPRRLMMWGYLTFAVVAALFINAPPVTDALVVYFVLFALSGLPNASSQIGSSATAQRFCPPELRGRLWGVAGATGAVAAAVGTVGVALLVDQIDIVPLFNAQALVYLSCGILTYALIVRRKTALEPAPVESA